MNFRQFFLLTVAVAFFQPAAAEIVVKDDTGREVRLKGPARRIVTLAPHAAENLFAVGGGNFLVGTVDYSDHPPEAARVPRIGGYSRIDLEAVVALKPDLVVAWQSGNASAQVAKLEKLGLTVFIQQPNLLEEVADQLRKLGQLTGQETTANATADRYLKRLDTLRATNAGKPRVKVFYQIWKTPLMTVGGQQIITDAIRLCGGENAFGQLELMAPTVSVEAVLEANPEVIVATGMGDARPDWLSDWDKWTRMTAVKRANLFHINPDIMQRHTPRILDGAEKLCAHLDVARGRRPK